MIRIQVDGEAIPVGGLVATVRVDPYGTTNLYSNAKDEQLTIGVVQSTVLDVTGHVNQAGLPNQGFWMSVRNVSTGNQQIGLTRDNTSTFAQCGQVLFPSEQFLFENILTNIFAIANAAGALLKVARMRTL